MGWLREGLYCRHQGESNQRHLEKPRADRGSSRLNLKVVSKLDLAREEEAEGEWRVGRGVGGGMETKGAA